MRVAINPPPREHEPPHVHVFDGDSEVAIEIPSDTERAVVRQAKGATSVQIARAGWLVEDNREYLMKRWREIHG